MQAGSLAWKSLGTLLKRKTSTERKLYVIISNIFKTKKNYNIMTESKLTYSAATLSGAISSTNALPSNIL